MNNHEMKTFWRDQIQSEALKLSRSVSVCGRSFLLLLAQCALQCVVIPADAQRPRHEGHSLFRAVFLPTSEQRTRPEAET